MSDYSYRIEIPEGATQKERESYIKKKAEEGFQHLMDTSPLFKEATESLWGRLGINQK